MPDPAPTTTTTVNELMNFTRHQVTNYNTHGAQWWVVTVVMLLFLVAVALGFFFGRTSWHQRTNP